MENEGLDLIYIVYRAFAGTSNFLDLSIPSDQKLLSDDTKIPHPTIYDT